MIGTRSLASPHDGATSETNSPVFLRGHLPLEEAGRFRQAVSDLAVIYGERIRIEDEVVFPAAKRVLSGAERSAIAHEMAFRRELGLPAGKP